MTHGRAFSDGKRSSWPTISAASWIGALMVIALVLPVLVRILRSDGSEQEVPQGERAAAEITRLVQ